MNIEQLLRGRVCVFACILWATSLCVAYTAEITVTTTDGSTAGSAVSVTASAGIDVDDTGLVTWSGDDTLVSLSETGQPDIPWQVLTVLLPADVDPHSVSAAVQAHYSEAYTSAEIAPVGPLAVWDEQLGQTVTIWPEDRTLTDGYDMHIYGHDAYWPTDRVRLVHQGMLRTYRLADVAVPLALYNPVTGSIRVLARADVTVSYDTPAVLRTQSTESSGRTTSAGDVIGRSVVQALAVNYQQMADAYENRTLTLATSDTESENEFSPLLPPGYTIITTQDIVANSTKLDDFVAHKQSDGYSVKVVTEADFGGGTGDAASDNIRAWLQNNYLADNTEYVLLIGDAHPESGDVPMKMLWPRYNYSMYRESPSDYYYADLTGDWDLDGDGNYGEESDDFGPGGIDRNWEVLVGRIPYYGVISDLDAILQQAIDYQNEDRLTAEWRQNVLLPMEPSDASTPGYHLGEQIINDTLAPEGWGHHRVYDDDYGLTPPPETYPCTVDNVVDVWSTNPFGLVVWWTHGSETEAIDIINNSRLPELNSDYPVFTFQVSCTNGYIERSDNLSYTMLRLGKAISAISATRVSWYYVGQTQFSNFPSNSGMSYEYSSRVISQDMSTARALYEVKRVLPLTIWMNFTVFNVYGDPSTHLTPQFHTLYVDDDAVGDPAPGDPTISNPDEDGTPAAPFDAILEAVGAANNGDIIVINPGTYTGTGNVDINFAGKNITIRSADPLDPDVVAATVIDCQNQGRGFVMGSGESNDAVLEGLTIRNAVADRGGAILCLTSTPLIRDCVIENSHATISGGAIACVAASPTITRCRLIGNSSPQAGSALLVASGSTPKVINSILTDNTTSSAVATYDSDTRLINCLIADNQAGGSCSGAAVYVDGGSPLLKNCSIINNNAGTTGGVFVYDGTTTITNTLLWGNTYSGADLQDAQLQVAGGSCDISYSCVQDWDGSLSGTNIITDDPMFADVENNDYHPTATSSTVDAGDPSQTYSEQVSLDGDSRVIGEFVDIGCYELPLRIVPPYHVLWYLDQSVNECLATVAGKGIHEWGIDGQIPGFDYTIQPENHFDSDSGQPQGWIDFFVDDVYWEYELPFAFPFYGQSYNTIYICDNGYIDFEYRGELDMPDLFATTQGLKDNVRVAPLWGPWIGYVYNSNQDIYIESTALGAIPGYVTIRWELEDYYSHLPVNFSVTLRDDGTIRFDYGYNPALPAGQGVEEPVVGVSAGNGSDYAIVDEYTHQSSLDNEPSLWFDNVYIEPVAGVQMDPGSGCFTGIPAATGQYDQLVTVADSSSPQQDDQALFSFEIAAAPLCGDVNHVPPAGDLDGDCMVTGNDVDVFRFYWNQSCDQPDWCQGADLNADGKVDLQDYALFVAAWQSCTAPQCP